MMSEIVQIWLSDELHVGVNRGFLANKQHYAKGTYDCFIYPLPDIVIS